MRSFGDLIFCEYSHENALDELRSDWFTLWQRCPNATPFQSPQWLIPWWKFLGRGELRIITLREKNRLVALAPLCVSPERELLLLGTGVSDYLDILVEPGFERAFLPQFSEFLSENSEHWTRCDFQQLPHNSVLLTEVSHDEIHSHEPCLVLELPENSEELSRFVPAHQLDNWRYYRRRAEKSGAVEFETATRENLDELLESFFLLHRARWENDGVLQGDTILNFHRAVAREFLDAGMLRLHALRLDGEIVAAFYGFAHHQRTYFYLSGFDPNFPKLSLGNLILGHAIFESVREKRRSFDFLRGCEPYKFLWGAKKVPTFRRTILIAGLHAKSPMLSAR